MQSAKRGSRLTSKVSDTHNDGSYIEVEPLDSIKQEERIAIIADELIKVKSKSAIIKEYSEKWQCAPSTIRSLINESIVWLASYSKDIEREDMRALNAERLEDIYTDARVSDKIKIIDLLNKTHGVYDTKVQLETKDTITIDLGV